MHNGTLQVAKSVAVLQMKKLCYDPQRWETSVWLCYNHPCLLPISWFLWPSGKHVGPGWSCMVTENTCKCVALILNHCYSHSVGGGALPGNGCLSKFKQFNFHSDLKGKVWSWGETWKHKPLLISVTFLKWGRPYVATAGAKSSVSQSQQHQPFAFSYNHLQVLKTVSYLPKSSGHHAQLA